MSGMQVFSTRSALILAVMLAMAGPAAAQTGWGGFDALKQQLGIGQGDAQAGEGETPPEPTATEQPAPEETLPMPTAETVPQVDPLTALPVPEFRDPFGYDATPPPCDQIAPREAEKFDCPAPVAEAPEPAPQETDQTAQTSGTDTTMPDPFAETSGETGETTQPATLPPTQPFVFQPTGGGTDTGTDTVPATTDTNATGGRRPMKRADAKNPDNPPLDRRVLTLPGAMLAETPGGTGGELPSFTVFYVYDEVEQDGAAWLEVGRDTAGTIAGWVSLEQTEDWPTMLVMQYAPKGDRGRVLFFKRRNELVQFVRDPHVAEEAEFAYEEIEAEDYDDDYFIAIEPAVGVDPDQVYLMPILDFKKERFDSLDQVMLLEVAGLNINTEAALQTDVTETENFGAPRRASEIRDFKFGITFVIDTTSSMGTYINLTRGVVHKIIGEFLKEGLEDKVSIGLVGYRDNISHDPRIEYVTRIYQPLKAQGDVRQVLENFEKMQPTSASTKEFKEDAFAGLDAAINTLDWEPFDFRMVVLITDAGARRGNDELATNQGYDILNVVENAERKKIALAAVHLLTPEAARAGDLAAAEEIYRQATRTGDTTTEKYFPVDTTDDAAFVAQVESLASQLASAVSRSAKGRVVKQTEEVETLGDALANEVFRAQLEYIGAKEGQEAPRFYRAWAADTDLLDQKTAALDVKVFLTRQQLGALMESARNVITSYERFETGGGDFFDLMRTLAAQTSVEGAGSRPLDEAGALFPSFLDALPYESRFLGIKQDQWENSGNTAQRELIEEMKFKLKAYEDIAASQGGWIDLGAGVPSEDVYPVNLTLLP